MENMDMEVVKPQSSALVGVEQSRAIAEAQGAMIVAKNFPRNVLKAKESITNACTRQGLAEAALYEYARGGTPITGPSIRLAEAIAQNWGNLQFGIRELEQRNGESTVEAFAWDMETNTRQVKVFQVAHKRYTRKGTYTLNDPRDIYEMTANQGARRLRACILGIVPGDVVEEAVKQCEATLLTRAEVTPERIQSLIDKFAEYKVTKKQIETRIQRHIDSISPAQLINLGKIYNSIKDGMSVAADWFEIEQEPEKASKVDTLKDKLRQLQTATVANEENTPTVTEEEKYARAEALRKEKAEAEQKDHSDPYPVGPAKPNCPPWILIKASKINGMKRLKVTMNGKLTEFSEEVISNCETKPEDLKVAEEHYPDELRLIRKFYQLAKEAEKGLGGEEPPKSPPMSPGGQEQEQRKEEMRKWCQEANEAAERDVTQEGVEELEYKSFGEVPVIEYGILKTAINRRVG